MTTFIVISSLVTYLTGAATSLYMYKTRQVFWYRDSCPLCQAIILTPTARKRSFTCSVCHAKLVTAEYGMSVDVDLDFLCVVSTIAWPVAAPIVYVSYKAREVLNRRIKDRLELERAEIEVEKLLKERT